MTNRGRFRKAIRRTHGSTSIGKRSTYSNPSWISPLPLLFRAPILFALWATALSLAIIAAPALLYAAFTARLSEHDEKNSGGSLAFGAYVTLLLIMGASSGASLLGVFRNGEFCFTPSRYAGLYCNTLEKSSVLFCASVAVFWVIFWVCISCAIVGFRLVAERLSRDA